MIPMGVARGVCQRAWSSCRVLQKRSCASLVSEARVRLEGLGGGEVTLDKDQHSGLATITLRHKEKKNAMSGRMMVQLADITEELVSWGSGKAVVVQAEGDFFCSGGDLSTVRTITTQHDGLLMASLMHTSLTTLYTLPLLTVSLVHGPALGGGAELITATDFRVFSAAAEVSFVHGKMGVIPGWGGCTRLARLVGSSAALHLLTTCMRLDAQAAIDVGLADHVVRAESRHEQMREWLDERVAHAPEVIQGFKSIVVRACDSPLQESLLAERETFCNLWGGPAHLQALQRNVKHK